MVAPLIAALGKTLLANGFGILANAIATKGKEVVEEKLGVSIDTMLGSEEGKLKLKQLELEHEEFLIKAAMENRKIDLTQYQIDAEDRDSARDMNAKVQDSANASKLAKNAAYILDFFIVGSTVLMGALLFFKQIPDDNLQIANILFGTLLGLCVTIVNFHRGSSAGSVKKDATIANMSAKE